MDKKFHAVNTGVNLVCQDYNAQTLFYLTGCISQTRIIFNFESIMASLCVL